MWFLSLPGHVQPSSQHPFAKTLNLWALEDPLKADNTSNFTSNRKFSLHIKVLIKSKFFLKLCFGNGATKEQNFAPGEIK